MAKRSASNRSPISDYPTIVIQFKSANGNLPPDMGMTAGEIAMFLSQGIAMINQQEHVNADISYGKTSNAQYEVLAKILEKSGE